MRMTLIASIIALFAVGCSTAKKQETQAAKELQSKEQLAKQQDSAKKKIEESKSLASIKCQLKEDIRTLEIKNDLKDKSSLCEVHYTKGDSSEKIASAKSEKTYCEEVVEKIKGKLEVAGFKCAS